MEKERDQVMVHVDVEEIDYGRRAAKRQRRTGGYNGNGNSSNDGIENERDISISNQQQQSREEVNKSGGDTINEVGNDNSLVVSNHSSLLAGYTTSNALSSAHIDTGVSC